MTVIGLGEAGCNIAEKFEGSEHFNVKLIDVDIEGDNCLSLQKQNTPEQYERNFPDISDFLSDVDEYVFFFVGGGGKISGASLRLLNQIKDRKIYIFYIRPDLQLMSETEKLQDNLVFNVMQEYTRSGVFNGTILIDNNNIETLLENNPVIGYYDNLNKVIVNAIKSITGTEAPPSAYENYSQPKDISCIATYGIYDFKSDVEKMFYNLEFIDDKCYYFFINKKRLETDGQLFKEIKKRMKNKSVDGTKISYIMYSTDAEEDFCYVTAFSSKIQK